MKKILHIISSLQYGGTEEFITNNYKYMDKEKYCFEVYVSQKRKSDFISSKRLEEFEAMGIIVNFGNDLESKINYMRGLSKYFKVNGPFDVVHSHMNIANSWVLFVAFLSGVKLRISHSHATSGLQTNNLIKQAYFELLRFMIISFSNKMLACSRQAGNYLYGENIYKNKGIFLENGIDLEKYQIVEKNKINIIKKEFNIPSEGLIFGNITRFDRNKNPSFTIDVFQEILKLNPNCTLVLGGPDGGELKSTLAKVESLNIQNKVIYVGIRKDVEVFLSFFDAYIFPSYSEGLGIVALESQAAGVPCFMSDRITKEVDMGLGLVTFIDRKESAIYWAKHILNYIQEEKTNHNVITERFQRLGYTSLASAKKLEALYDEKK